VIQTVNNAVSQNNAVLTALADKAQYQWINCSQGNKLVEGATNKTFTPDSSGNYAVVVSQNGCIDTSVCLEVKLVGVGSPDKFADLAIYPNPAKDILFIDSEKEPTLLIFYDPSGKQCLKQTHNTRQVDVNHLPPGVYLLELYFGQERV